MERSLRSRRIRAVLIPLNFVLATGMLLSLVLGIPSVTAIAGVMVVATIASIIAVAIER
jgi:hypothetical protein